MTILKFVLISILFTFRVIGQESLAKMTMDYESTGCNAGIKFHKDELIIVFKPFEETNIWPVWNTNGDYSHLDSLSFKIIPNKPIFKLNSNQYKIKAIACGKHCKDNFDIIGVDYCDIISRITQKDTKALTEFFDLIPKIDASLSEIHAEQTWQIINLFTDKELYFWIVSLDKNRLERLMNYLQDEFVAYPISRYDEYLSLYYPKSWEKLKRYKK